VDAAAQQALKTPGTEAVTARRLAAIAAAQLHARLHGRSRDRMQARGEGYWSVVLCMCLPGRQQLVGRKLTRRREQERPFERVLELADVAGPGVGAEAGVQLGRERRRREIVLSREPGEQGLRDQPHVVPPLPHG